MVAILSRGRWVKFEIWSMSITHLLLVFQFWSPMATLTHWDMDKNANLLFIVPAKTHTREIIIKTKNFPFKKMHLKVSFAKWQPFISDIKVLKYMLLFKQLCYGTSNISSTLVLIKPIKLITIIISMYQIIFITEKLMTCMTGSDGAIWMSSLMSSCNCMGNHMKVFCQWKK